MGESRPRLSLLAYIALALTLLIVFLPFAFTASAYWRTGRSLDWDAVAPTALALAIAALVWGILALPRFRSFLLRRETSARARTFSAVADPEIIRAFLGGNDAPCHRCSYNLRGLPPGNCPECQEPIRLFVVGPRSLHAGRWVTRLAFLAFGGRVLCSLMGLAVMAWAGGSFLAYMSSPEFAIYLLKEVSTVLGACWVITAIIRWRRCHETELRRLLHWRAVSSAIALVTILTLFDVMTYLIWASRML